MPESQSTYNGDIFYEDFREHVENSELVDRAVAIAEQVGFSKYDEANEGFLQRLHHFDRLFGSVYSARIKFKSDFDELLKDEASIYNFLSELRKMCNDRGFAVVAVREDVCTFLVFRKRGDYLTPNYVREVAQFKPELNEALIELLELS